MIRTAKELAEACVAVAKKHKTLYVMGCFGAPLNQENKTRYIENYTYNQKNDRAAMIRAASDDTFGFDCVCLIKGILWGWTGAVDYRYGGAQYASNGVPDIGTEQLIEVCTDVSEDFLTIQIGELLWIKGHVGIYAGNGVAVECTPVWRNCVQLTGVQNVGGVEGMHSRRWKKHGKLPYISYADAPVTDSVLFENTHNAASCFLELPLLWKGSRGNIVRAAQILLIGYGYDCGECQDDGEFGASTENAVRWFQSDNMLTSDGIIGCKTWAALLEAEGR